MGKVRTVQDRRGWAYPLAIALLKPTLLATTKRSWVGGDKIPATGGCVIVMNHISHIDPLTLGHFLYEHGRLVRYLAKDSLWRVPLLKHVCRDCGHIPVAREVGGGTSFAAAVEAVRRGECVGVYPEGTITKDPEGWPMRGKSGAARIALATGAPVVPIGQWGAQEVLPAYTARPHVVPRRTTHYRVGDPVELDDLREGPMTSQARGEATTRIMDAITGLVEELRQQKAPAQRFDPAAGGSSRAGAPHGPTPEEEAS